MNGRFSVPARGMVAALLFACCLLPVAVAAQDRPDPSAMVEIQAIRPDLDAEIAELRHGVRIHTGGLIGGFLFPPLWPVGTVIGSLQTLSAATNYRDRIMTTSDEDPLPELRGARRWHLAGMVGHGVAGIGFASLAVLAVTALDPSIDVSTELEVVGGAMVGGLVVGLVGTTVGTWRARNTTLRFHLSLSENP